MAELRRETVEPARCDGHLRKQLRMPVPRNDLGCGRLDGKAEVVEHLRFERRIEHRVGSDRPGQGSDARAGDRCRESLLISSALERKTCELEAERRGLGVDAVGAPDGDGLPLLQSAFAEHLGERRLLGEQDRS